MKNIPEKYQKIFVAMTGLSEDNTTHGTTNNLISLDVSSPIYSFFFPAFLYSSINHNVMEIKGKQKQTELFSMIRDHDYVSGIVGEDGVTEMFLKALSLKGFVSVVESHNNSVAGFFLAHRMSDLKCKILAANFLTVYWDWDALTEQETNILRQLERYLHVPDIIGELLTNDQVTE